MIPAIQVSGFGRSHMALWLRTDWTVIAGSDILISVVKFDALYPTLLLLLFPPQLWKKP